MKTKTITFQYKGKDVARNQEIHGDLQWYTREIGGLTASDIKKADFSFEVMREYSTIPQQIEQWMKQTLRVSEGRIHFLSRVIHEAHKQEKKGHVTFYNAKKIIAFLEEQALYKGNDVETLKRMMKSYNLYQIYRAMEEISVEGMNFPAGSDYQVIGYQTEA